MPVPKKKSKSHDLPTKAPKRTGKKGIHPPESTEVAVTLLADAIEEAEQELLKTPANAKKSRRQPRLPAMEDPEIEDLEDAAKDYAEIRDQRMVLTKKETALKDDLLNLMKENGKRSYNHAGVSIRIIVESEKVKVVVKDDDGE